MKRLAVSLVLGFIVLFLLPIAVSVVLHRDQAISDWWQADRSSAGLLPAQPGAPAAVRIYAARTVSWRGAFAVHSWVVLKNVDGPYERYDLTAWGDPIRVNGFVADGRWFGQVPQVVYGADGVAAEALIPRMRAAIADYRYRNRGDYTAWPGPNSNTFVATIMAAVPEISASLPSNAIGKDYPVDGRWIAPTPSHTGLRLSLSGYVGLTLGWVEGVQFNILGAVFGLDLRRPALLLPGLGRIGVANAVCCRV